MTVCAVPSVVCNGSHCGFDKRKRIHKVENKGCKLNGYGTDVCGHGAQNWETITTRKGKFEREIRETDCLAKVLSR
jgi:hypothetical protein